MITYQTRHFIIIDRQKHKPVDPAIKFPQFLVSILFLFFVLSKNNERLISYELQPKSYLLCSKIKNHTKQINKVKERKIRPEKKMENTIYYHQYINISLSIDYFPFLLIHLAQILKAPIPSHPTAPNQPWLRGSFKRNGSSTVHPPMT